MLYLILLTTLGSIAGLIGGVLFLVKESWAKALSKISVPFASGVLLAISFLDLLPEAEHAVGETAYLIVLAAFVILFVFEKFFIVLHHHDHEHGHKGRKENAVIAVLAGDTIHNFLDGLTIGVAYLVDPAFALVVALGTFLHETPHEIADFGILVKRGWSRQKAFAANFVSALATFPGAFLAYSIGGSEFVVGMLLALAAGLFLYVATTDFIPEMHHSREGDHFKQVAYFVLGVIIVLASHLVLPEAGH